MTNAQVINLYETLCKLSQNEELKFKVRPAYIMAKNKELLKPEAKIIYDLKLQILLKHGKPDGEGNVVVENQYIETVKKELDELFWMENQLELLQLNVDDLDGSEIGLQDMENLMPICNLTLTIGPPIYYNKEKSEDL